MSLTSRRMQAAAASAAARERARQAAEQVGPVAKSARDNAARRVHGARKWMAPRIEQAAQTVQGTVAPKVSAALTATAQRVQPTPQELKKIGRRAQRRALTASQQVSTRRKKLAKARKPPRRWPKVTGGTALLMATAGAAIAMIMRRGRAQSEFAAPTASSPSDESRSAPADAEVGSDGQVRTP